MTRRMTDQDHDEVIKVFVGLWPEIANKMTDEQWSSWKRVWSSYTVNQAIRALRGLKDTSTKFPESALLRKHLREECANQKKSGETTHNRSWEQHHIMIMAEAMPDLSREIESMTERNMRTCLLLWEWRMAIRTYGTLRRMTVSAYWKWQKHVDANAPFSNWSLEAQQEYQRRVRNLEQLEADRVDMPKPWLGHILRDFFRERSEEALLVA
ncbi:MAG: hypothetical protein ACF8OB_00905 [Phycisphaeraceae bacterium JB051]